MSTLATVYSPTAIEEKWYAYWLEHRLFHSEPDGREPYAMVIPPPNVTGVLHMGHMLNNTIQDVLVRRARMLGKNACWVPGTDHASIATEAKVVEKLAREGIKKADLSREAFLEHAWEWTRRHGGIILEQLKRLGASCDWERTSFTMSEGYSRSVIRVFVDLYNQGKIYRGVRMVNWDPQAQTALSDEEVIYREQQAKLYYLRYCVSNPDAAAGAAPQEQQDYIVVATTRPETIFGDTAVCVNPNDERYKRLKGKKLIVPLINREVPVIEDAYVDPEFGTGCLKVTPAHDVNDYMLGEKYGLEVIDIFNDNGTLSEKAQLYVGQDRFEVRRQVEIDLAAAGLLEKVEDYVNKVGFSERTNAAIEPKLSMQWFVRMGELAEPALAAVMDDDVLLFPPKFKNTYRHWMENIKDWCISRQLWWGHRIPAWYLPQGGLVVAETAEEALALAKEKTKNQLLTLSDLRQDEDCLDTWFSSWLWPVSVFDTNVAGHPEADPNNDLQYYYPTADLVTAPEILFFWVARMIIAGYEWAGGYPFKNVYLTGIVRDKQGRKMSKQLGNSPDPITLIEKYGADGVRLGMLLTSPAGNDLPFDESLCEQGRNFCNKIWNAFRLIKTWEPSDAEPQPEHAQVAVEWFVALLSKTLLSIADDFDKYRLSEALMELYKLYWDEFSSWYLEIIKPQQGRPIDKKTYSATLAIFDAMLRLLHPFMPFITEELWQNLAARKDGESIMVALQPFAPQEFDESALGSFEQAKQVVTSIRSVRKDKNIPSREPLKLLVRGEISPAATAIVSRLANISQVVGVDENADPLCASFLVKTTEFYLPLGSLVNVAEERKKLEADLAYFKKFLGSVLAKLGNEKFVGSAPESIVALERKKQRDAEAKIASLEEQLKKLKAG
ncbi:MAG: valine--tRNA ligase [Prevotellaceae bacterium]|jgi:valyl-tRNA synthetase|nr:valine--tRNA ligase [Prevotellaceae bacterium]